jgi:hypothetical protein
MNAIEHTFPEAESLLCTWHANKAVLRYCSSDFSQFEGGHDTSKNQAWKDFYAYWHSLVGASTETAYDELLEEFKN